MLDIYLWTVYSTINIFEKLHLSKDLQNRYPHELSGGQRQRISIGRALIVKPKILILDEPTSSLDHVVECEILNLLKEIQAHNEITYIVISHNLEVIESIADEVGIISNGKIIDFGEVNLLLKKYQNIEWYFVVKICWKLLVNN